MKGDRTGGGGGGGLIGRGARFESLFDPLARRLFHLVMKHCISCLIYYLKFTC